MNKNIKLIINYLLGPLLFVLLSLTLYRQIARQDDLAVRWQEIRMSWKQPGFWIVFALMFLNWGIEARKWQLLLMPLQKFSLAGAYKAVLAGCSITMLTPNRIGEYGGRIMYVDEPFRLRAVSLTILGSMAQLTITMLMGTIGLVLIRTGKIIDPTKFSGYSWMLGNTLLVISIIVTVILLLVLFRVNFIVTAISGARFLKNIVKHISVVEQVGGKQLLRILNLSFFRYMVFILQYILLLKVMEVNIAFPVSFLLLTIFYLVMAVAPTAGFTELPVRAIASVALFNLFSTNIIGIQAAAFGIWLINLVVPAVLGSLLILGIKIMKER